MNGCNLTEQYLREINAVYEEDYLPKMAYAVLLFPARTSAGEHEVGELIVVVALLVRSGRRAR